MKRELYFDYLRGLAIIMVVAIHCYPGEIRLTDGPLEFLMIVCRNIMNSAVPLFLAISGYFIGKRFREVNFNEYRTYLKRQIPRIYIPCMIFSIPWLLLTIFNCGGGVIKNVILTFLCGMSVYYFILLIICCYVSAPYMIMTNSKRLIVFTGLLSLFSITTCLYVGASHNINIPLIVQGSIISFGVFFAIGIIVGKEDKEYSVTWPLVTVIIGLLLSIAETYFLQTEFGTTGAGQKASAFIFNIGVLFLIFCPSIRKAYRDTPIQRAIRWIGDLSFGIYFTHVLVLDVLKRVFLNNIDSWLLSTLITICSTLILIISVKKIAPDLSKKYLGFR